MLYTHVDNLLNLQGSNQPNSNSRQLSEDNQPREVPIDRKIDQNQKSRSITGRQNNKGMSDWSISSTPPTQPNHINQMQPPPPPIAVVREEYENNLKAMSRQLYNGFSEFWTTETLNSLTPSYATAITDNQSLQYEEGEQATAYDEFDDFFTVKALDSLIPSYAAETGENQPFQDKEEWQVAAWQEMQYESAAQQQAGRTSSYIELLEKDKAQIDKEVMKYLDKSGSTYIIDTQCELELEFSNNISKSFTQKDIQRRSSLVIRLIPFFERAIERARQMTHDSQTAKNILSIFSNLKRTQSLFCHSMIKTFLQQQGHSTELNKLMEVQVKFLEKYLILFNSKKNYRGMLPLNRLYFISFILEQKPKSDIILSNISSIIHPCLEKIKPISIKQRDLLVLPHLLLCLSIVVMHDNKHASLALPLISEVIARISEQYYIISNLKSYVCMRLVAALKYLANMKDELLTDECKKLVLRLKLELELELELNYE